MPHSVCPLCSTLVLFSSCPSPDSNSPPLPHPTSRSPSLYLLLSTPPPQVVTMQPQATHVFVQSQPPATNLPLYALVTSLVVTLIFTGFCCYIPGLLCLIPAVSTALYVSVPQWNTVLLHLVDVFGCIVVFSCVV